MQENRNENIDYSDEQFRIHQTDRNALPNAMQNTMEKIMKKVDDEDEAPKAPNGMKQLSTLLMGPLTLLAGLFTDLPLPQKNPDFFLDSAINER